jgi:AhpD family alkylhydroperoxidase
MMQARMKNPALVVPGAMQALLSLGASIKKDVIPLRTQTLVHLRASQINSCAFCVDMHVREARKLGESQDRLDAVVVFRESPLFDDAERAALALTEAVTRLSDRADAVPNELWQEVERHFDENARAVLVLHIAAVNLWNRLNVTTKQVPGTLPR